MDYNLETEASNYEAFLNRFFRLDKRITRPHKSELINLIKAQDGDHKNLPNFDVQLNEIIKRIDWALEKFYTLDIQKEKKNGCQYYRVKILKSKRQMIS